MRLLRLLLLLLLLQTDLLIKQQTTNVGLQRVRVSGTAACQVALRIELLYFPLADEAIHSLYIT